MFVSIFGKSCFEKNGVTYYILHCGYTRDGVEGFEVKSFFTNAKTYNHFDLSKMKFTDVFDLAVFFKSSTNSVDKIYLRKE